MIKRPVKSTPRKKTPKAAESRVTTQADYKQQQFDAKAKELIWQLTIGGGSANLHVLDTLRALEWAYLTLAAYRMAAKSAAE